MHAIAILFWLGIFIVLYTYIGYACLMYVLVKLKQLFLSSAKISDTYFEPEVSLVIPCFNEKDVLEMKVKNSLELDYPKEKLHIIFITDGSTDGSDLLLKKFSEITVLHQERRSGKTAAENRAMQFVQTPFVIFCDANTSLNVQSVKEVVKHYKNEKVGAVSGEKRIISKNKDSASAAGEGIYWKYESLLKKLDSQLYSAVGGAGELISFRCSLYSHLKEDTILDDFMQSMQIAIKGYKVAYEPNAYAEETASANVDEELKRKVRISAGSWQAMARLGEAFNPFHNLALAFTFVSHKVLRWTLAPFCLLLIIPINIYLHFLSGGLYSLLLYGQIIFYSLAALGWYFENRRLSVKIAFVPYYFAMTNWCMYLGFFRFLKGKQSVTWDRSKRA